MIAPDANTDDQLDAIFHALADRTRRAMLVRLSLADASVTELAGPFAMSLPAVSKHLRVLERAGLVSRTVEGRVHRCGLAPAPMADAAAWLDRARRQWEDTLGDLAQFVEDEPDVGG